jgi:uncharacterized membrane-anchored protein
MGAAWRMIAVVVLFALALGAIIVQRVNLVNGGREVVLQVEPVDPRDFFRGDFVTLSYDGLTQIVVPGASGWAGARRGEPFYVALDVAPDGHARAKSIHTTLDAARKASPIVIRGKVQWSFSRRNEDSPQETVVRAQYGIESYFVPEGEGRALETARNAHRLEMLIALADDGEAAIKGVILDGKRAYVEGLF